MDIKYPIENEYMKCVLQINGFSDLHSRVRSSLLVGSGKGSRHLRPHKLDGIDEDNVFEFKDMICK